MYMSQQRTMFSGAPAFGYGTNHNNYNLTTGEQGIQTPQSCYYNSPARYSFNNYPRTPNQSFSNSCSYSSLPPVPNGVRPQNNFYNDSFQSNYASRTGLHAEGLLHIPRHPARDLPEVDDKPISPDTGKYFS